MTQLQLIQKQLIQLRIEFDTLMLAVLTENHEERLRMLEEFHRKARDGSFEFSPRKRIKKITKKKK